VFSVPRSALRDGETIWLLSDENRLEIRTVSPVWRDAEQVFLNEGLREGDRLVISEIPAPVNGMELRVEEKMRRHGEETH
jgi:hypothetical protein